VSPEQAFGQVLRELRRDRGLSQEAFAEVGRCSRPHISRLESGRNSPSLSMLFQLAEALQIEPATLIQRVQNKLQE
jgi:transcriptional regulator with XRE-family HTH domain